MRELAHVPAKLIRALRRSPLVPEDHIDVLVRRQVVGQDFDNRGTLTERQTRIVAYLSHGLTLRMVADAMHFSLSTVQTDVDAARLSLGVKNRTHLVADALRRGLID